MNRTTNLTNGAGQTGAAIFNNYTDLTITNNLRPAGATRGPSARSSASTTPCGTRASSSGREAVFLSGRSETCDVGRTTGGVAAAAVAMMGIVATATLHLRAQAQGRPAPAGGGSGPPPRGQREHDAAAVGQRDPAEPELLRDRSAVHARRAAGLGDRRGSRRRSIAAWTRSRSASAACISRGAC